jgi:hypothetical protein
MRAAATAAVTTAPMLSKCRNWGHGKDKDNQGCKAKVDEEFSLKSTGTGRAHNLYLFETWRQIFAQYYALLLNQILLARQGVAQIYIPFVRILIVMILAVW